MKFSLTFDMDGAAFDGGDNGTDEVERILAAVAARIGTFGTDADTHGKIMDANGNTIGRWEVSE